MFGFPPESCSPSDRNTVRFHPGIVFGLNRNRQFGERLTIIDGPRLFTLLQDHYPDYKSAGLEYAAGAVKKLRIEVREDRPLARLAFASIQAEVSRDVHLIYVQPSFEVVLHEWTVNRARFLADLVPEAPSAIMARSLGNKLPKINPTGFYWSAVDYVSRLAAAAREFRIRAEVFAELALIESHVAVSVDASYKELIRCFDSVMAGSVSKVNSKRLRTDYGDRLVLPPGNVVVLGHDEMLRLSEQIQALKKTLDVALDGIALRLVEVFALAARG